MYELMKRKFVERYWARQKANNKDWKAFNAAEVAEQLGRSINQKLSPLPDEEPAYQNNNIEVKDPIDEDVMMKLAKLESYIHLSPTGAIIISDDTGSEIRMEGGHITISPAVDIKLQPGRDMSATIPRFASIFSGKRLDLTSDKDEVTIHADKNVTVSGEGFVTIESRNKNTTTSSDPDKRGEGGGVIIRSATDASIISHSIRMTLQNANDDSQTGQKTVFPGEHPVKIAQVGCVHVVNVFIAVHICLGDLPGAMTVAGNAVAVQLPPCGGINGVADFLPAHRRGGDLKPRRQSGLCRQIFHHKFRHGTAANIAVADEHYFNHKSTSSLYGYYNTQKRQLQIVEDGAFDVPKRFIQNRAIKRKAPRWGVLLLCVRLTEKTLQRFPASALPA